MSPAHLRRSAWLAVLAGTLVLAGCSGQGAPSDGGAGDSSAAASEGGGGDDGEGSSAAGSLCSILTEADIADLSGGEVTASDLSEEDCDFTIDDTSLVNVRYESSFDPNLETAKLVCDDEEDLSGIGDQAIWCPGLNVLYFNRGDRSLAVQLVFLTDATRAEKDIASDIARRIAEGL